MKNNNKKLLLRGATVLGLGAFISKLLGAIYRIPLTNYLGSQGIGLYQMVFPVYALLLDFSGCAVPSAMSKIIASKSEKEQVAERILRVSLKLLSVIGLFFSLSLIVFAKPIAILQGNKDAYLSYISLAPAIFFVAIISCFRGYFQGNLNMTPTAISQIIEQVIKLFVGVIAVKILLPDIKYAVAGATFSITVAEVFALISLYLWYKKSKKSNYKTHIIEQNTFASDLKLIIKTALPITLIGLVLPFSQVVDSFLTVNILSAYRTDATALYGLLGGVSMTIINLPVSVCHGVSTVAIPTVSGLKTIEEQNKTTLKALFITLAISLPCAIFCFSLSPFIINFLYRSLTFTDKAVAINLLKLTSPCIVLLSITQTLNGVLIGRGNVYLPMLSLGVGVLIKIIVNIILLRNQSINIYGGGVALIACYFFTCLINLFMIFRLKVKYANKITCRREYAN